MALNLDRPVEHDITAIAANISTTTNTTTTAGLRGLGVRRLPPDPMFAGSILAESGVFLRGDKNTARHVLRKRR